jgi:hypothetical protein
VAGHTTILLHFHKVQGTVEATRQLRHVHVECELSGRIKAGPSIICLIAKVKKVLAFFVLEQKFEVKICQFFKKSLHERGTNIALNSSQKVKCI